MACEDNDLTRLIRESLLDIGKTFRTSHQTDGIIVLKADDADTHIVKIRDNDKECSFVEPKTEKEVDMDLMIRMCKMQIITVAKARNIYNERLEIDGIIVFESDRHIQRVVKINEDIGKDSERAQSIIKVEADDCVHDENARTRVKHEHRLINDSDQYIPLTNIVKQEQTSPIKMSFNNAGNTSAPLENERCAPRQSAVKLQPHRTLPMKIPRDDYDTKFVELKNERITQPSTFKQAQFSPVLPVNESSKFERVCNERTSLPPTVVKGDQTLNVTIPRENIGINNDNCQDEHKIPSSICVENASPDLYMEVNESGPINLDVIADTTIKMENEQSDTYADTQEIVPQNNDWDSAVNILCDAFPESYYLEKQLQVASASDLCCKDCYSTFTDIEQLKAHIFLKHGHLTCLVCLQTYGTRPSLRRHIESHVKDDRECSVCKEIIYTNKENFRKHERKCETKMTTADEGSKKDIGDAIADPPRTDQALGAGANKRGQQDILSSIYGAETIKDVHVYDTTTEVDESSRYQESLLSACQVPWNTIATDRNGPNFKSVLSMNINNSAIMKRKTEEEEIGGALRKRTNLPSTCDSTDTSYHDDNGASITPDREEGAGNERGLLNEPNDCNPVWNTGYHVFSAAGVSQGSHTVKYSEKGIGHSGEVDIELPPDSVTQGDFKPVTCTGETTLISFDLETTDLIRGRKIPHITQIAAMEFKSRHVFNKFVLPKQPITASASKMTGISISDCNVMTVNGCPVESLSIKKALSLFCAWLEQFKNVIIIAHNGRYFDFPVIITAMNNVNLLDRLYTCVSGFVDSLPVLRKQYPGRQSYRQEHLVLGILKTVYRAHDASEDVRSLCDLLQHNVSVKTLMSFSFSPKAVYFQVFNSKNQRIFLN